MHQLRGSAIPAGHAQNPLSDFDEIFVCYEFLGQFCWAKCEDYSQNRENFETLVEKCRSFTPLQFNLHDHRNTLQISSKQEIRFVELGVCPMQLFHFWSRDVHLVQNLLLCTKFHENGMIFSLRYGDISIFKMAAVCRLGIVLPPYETTHEVSVTGRSCMSNFMSIWYIGLKCLFRPPKWGFWGTLDPLNVIVDHRDPQKAHPCVNSSLLSYQL